MLRTNQPIVIDGSAAEPRPRRFRLIKRRIALALVAAFLLLVLWLAVTAPLSRSLQPIEEPSVTLLAADGTPIARRGAIVDAPTRVETLPDHVYQAFLAIEDRRFYNHAGINLVSIGRAAWSNFRAGSVREGGSTITQQLAKLAFLSSDRTAGRKLREILIAFWLEANLSKDEILSRYLSTVYFGDNVYGLRAAARHYFDKTPETLSVAEAAMLAGLVKAPSRLAPTSNLKGARERAKLVLSAMVREGVLSRERADALEPARLRKGGRAESLPSGTWFADWTFRQLREADEEEGGEPREAREFRTTLDSRLQSLAERTLARADLGGAQAALVAMRPNGRIVAMVGGTDYRSSAFNRVTQARRQPGSTFKLFVYLAALEEGLLPETPILDSPVTIDGWSPGNADGRYRGMITLRQAFAESSNVAAVRLAQRVGPKKVADAARRLGIESPLEPNPSLALGTSAVTLLELTSAFAGVAGNRFPVRPHGLPDALDDADYEDPLDKETILPRLLDLLWQSANAGTGRAAALRRATFGKTGTSQDHRDALFVGFVEGLVVGIWVGRDDNRPLEGVSGGGLPAELWRDFVARAVGAAPAAQSPVRRRAAGRDAERQPYRPVPIRLVGYRDDDPRWGERGGRDKDEGRKGGKDRKDKDKKDKKGKGKGKD